MWSEALRILDENTLKYYVEQLQQQIDEDKVIINQQADELAQKEDALAQQAARIAELEKLLEKTI